MPVVLAALCLGAFAAAPAHAVLGQGAASVEADRAQVRASVRQVSHAAFTVHEMNTEMNGIIREYVAPSGQVFAVSWHSPTMPNLRQLMGVHYATMVAAPRRPMQRNYFSMQSGNLVYESAGHMRSFHGRAYLADAFPPGVTANDIQ